MSQSSSNFDENDETLLQFVFGVGTCEVLVGARYDLVSDFIWSRAIAKVAGKRPEKFQKSDFGRLRAAFDSFFDVQNNLLSIQDLCTKGINGLFSIQDLCTKVQNSLLSIQELCTKVQNNLLLIQDLCTKIQSGLLSIQDLCT